MQCAYLLVAVIAPLSLISQIARSSLTGTVTDPQGRGIPGATVHALENASGLERESITNSDGAYLLDSLPVGIYSVSFSKTGFAEFNNITLDGVDATAIYNQEQRDYVRLSIPLESIGEFQAQSQNFGADAEGGFAGGQVSVATPSGTNQFHGDVFHFHRNDALDARTPFDGPSPNPFLLNQFGGNIGGPLKRNKTFFYANYEGLRQRLGQTQIGLVPSPFFVSQALVTSPALAPILSAYPHGTSPNTTNVSNYNVEANAIDNEDAGMIRLDQHFSDRTTAFVRFNMDHAENALPAGVLNILNGGRQPASAFIAEARAVKISRMAC